MCIRDSIGDSDSTTSGGGDSGPVTDTTTTTAGSATAGVSSSTVTTSDPSGTTAGTSAGGVCPSFDPGPVGDPHETYAYECFCESCELSYEDIPLETLQLFENEGLCDCLCNQAGCGDVQGEGGVATGSPTGGEGDSDCAETESGTSGSWPDTDSGGSTSGSWPDTDGDTGEM
ncbi:MAG: hypothetical protein KUG77_19175 [Nannocystaceae bacterium]|nr:hypothetical protein [Nannocystaceae bacterium]